ncbi:Isochorismatase-like protein [Mucidula mucida]|nr:Isochorismatase-like protein [Mucidula mucida]
MQLFGTLSFVALAIVNVTSAFKFQCLDKNNLVLLVVNHQMGLFQLVCNYSPEEYKNNVMVHASLGKVFNLPTISLLVRKLVSPNGFLPREIIEMHPNAPFIKRQGEVNAWDNANFRAAVRATGKKQVILTGIVTDVRRSPTVCTAFLALFLVEEGSAGVQVISMFAIVCNLMRDWRNTPGALELLPFYNKYTCFGNREGLRASRIEEYWSK